MAFWTFFYVKEDDTADLELAGPAVQRILALAETVVVETVAAVQAFEIREGLQSYLYGLAEHVGTFDGWKPFEGFFAGTAFFLLNMTSPLVFYIAD